MTEIDYEDWLIEKSEIFGFDDLKEYEKEAIYEVEIGFTDEDGLRLNSINHATHTIFFYWYGYRKEFERIKEISDSTGFYPGDIRRDEVLKEELADFAHELNVYWKFAISNIR